MLTGVGSWYREGGRIGKRELVDQYTRLVMQCVGATHIGTVRRARTAPQGRLA